MAIYFYLPQSCPTHDELAKGFETEASSVREAAKKLPYKDFSCKTCTSRGEFGIQRRADPLPDHVRPFSLEAVDF